MARKVHEAFTFQTFDVETPGGTVRILEFIDSDTKEVDHFVLPVAEARKVSEMLAGGPTLKTAPASALSALERQPQPGARRQR